MNGEFVEKVPTEDGKSYDVRITRPADKQYEVYEVVVPGGLVIREKGVVQIGDTIYQKKNIGDFGRIISDANYDGKLYGTIEDVVEIINLYYYK